MRVYVAAPWICKPEAMKAGQLIEAKGHLITENWWEHPEVFGYLQDTLSQVDEDELAEQAWADVAGVINADVFFLVNLSKSEGKAVETGIALISQIPRLILVGKKSNLFHYLGPWETFETVEAAVEAL